MAHTCIKQYATCHLNKYHNRNILCISFCTQQTLLIIHKNTRLVWSYTKDIRHFIPAKHGRFQVRPRDTRHFSSNPETQDISGHTQSHKIFLVRPRDTRHSWSYPETPDMSGHTPRHQTFLITPRDTSHFMSYPACTSHFRSYPDTPDIPRILV